MGIVTDFWSIWILIYIEIEDSPPQTAPNCSVTPGLPRERKIDVLFMLRKTGAPILIVSVLPLTCDSLPHKHPFLWCSSKEGRRCDV